METVSAGAVLSALGPLAVGHLLAMLLVMLPFALLITLVEWQRQIQLGASLLVIAFGISRLAQAAPSAGAGADTADATRRCGRLRSPSLMAPD